MTRLLLRIVLVSITPVLAYAADPGDSTRFRNPVIPGDFADPSIIRVGNMYYATGTSSEWAPYFPVFSSPNLLNWKQTGYILHEKPEWALSSFWAPEYFKWNDTYFLYYVAKRKSDSISCIGVATSKYPDKGFVDRGVMLEYGREAIDPFVINVDGRLYLTFKAYGLDKRPIELLAVSLSPDGRKVTGKPFSLLKDSLREGMEGQSIIRKNGYYYVLYAAGACCGRECSYHVNVARAKSIRGPFEIYKGNPILDAGQEWKCMGHGTPLAATDGKYYYLCHGYSKKDNVFTGRQGLVRELLWNAKTSWPSFKPEGSPLPNEARTTTGTFRDDFTDSLLSNRWQWDFRYSQPKIERSNGHLFLAGQTDSGNATGTVLTVRPLSGNYEMSAVVTNTNASLKGLAVYGDVSQSVGIGVTGDTLQLWEVRDNKRLVLQQQGLDGQAAVHFKIKVESGAFCRFYWSLDENKWQELNATGGQPYDGSRLPPWDRSPRPGLHHYGKAGEPSAFTNFQINFDSE